MHSNSKSPKLIIGSFIFLVLYTGALLVFADPPATKYQPGEILDPTCGPGDTNCSVETVEVERGTGAPASTPTGLDPVVYVDEATGNVYSWDGSTWNLITSGGGSGTVTSVGLTVPTGFSVSGSPITSSGTLAITTALSGVLIGTGSGFSTATISSPLTYSSSTLSINNAAADGTTKGAASFTAADFNATSGLISLDYTNGQAASGSTKGFLTAADWTTFNNKLSTVAVDGLTVTGDGTIGNPLIAVGGGSTPAGSNTQIQFNNSGVFGASAYFSWNNSSKTLAVNGTGIFTDRAVDNSYVYDQAFVDNPGGDLDDAIISQTYTGPATLSYSMYVWIDSTNPDTFAWEDTDGGQGSGIPIDGTAQPLTNGLTVTFGALTGHTQYVSNGDSYWELDVTGSVNPQPLAFDVRDVNSSSFFSIDPSDSLIMMNGVDYFFPNSQGGANTVLTNDGSGSLTWVPSSSVQYQEDGSDLGDAGDVGVINFTGSTIASLAGSTLTISSLLGSTSRTDSGTGTETWLGTDPAIMGTASNVYTVFIGSGAGVNASGGQGVFIGRDAGSNTDADLLNAIGTNAGLNATNAIGSNFFGGNVGISATNAYGSNFFGDTAGNGATDAHNSNFIGNGAGKYAFNATFSIFIGDNAGGYPEFESDPDLGAKNAAHSIFIGTNAGRGDQVDNVTVPGWSILIGDNTSTGEFSNSIALGKDAINTATKQFVVGSTTAPIDEMNIIGTGGQSCTFRPDTGSPSCTSDERLKTNILDLDTNILENLTKIRTITYNWKEGDMQTSHIGFLAQDLQLYYPQLVSTGPGGYLQVNYAGVTPLLIEAVRELDLKFTTVTDFANVQNKTFFDGLIAWLGDTGNGIVQIFAHKFKTDEIETSKLCVDDVCVTRDQFLNMVNTIQNQQAPNGVQNSGSPETPIESLPETGDNGGISDGSETANSSDDFSPPESTPEPTPSADISIE